MRRLIVAGLVAPLILGACSEGPAAPLPDAPASWMASVAPAAPCGVTDVTLWAGQHTDAGTVSMANDEDNLYVTVTAANGWSLVETHIAAGASVADIPTNKPGNPQPGQFADKASHAAGTTSHTAVFALADLGASAGDGVVVAAHADVANGSQSEGAWGAGTRFTDKNWATYSSHTVAECGFDVLVFSNRSFDNDHVVDTFGPLMPNVTFTKETSPAALTPAFLSQFRVVLLFENGLTGSPGITIGNALAAYVASGGNLVIGTFYWQNRSDNPGYSSAGWGALEAIDPLEAPPGMDYWTFSAQYEYRSATLDLGSVVAHPLTAGLGPLTVGYYPNGMAAKAGTTVVASYTDGAPFLSFVEYGLGQRIVAVTAFPPHLDYGGISGDFTTPWLNAITWAGAASAPAAMSPLTAQRRPHFQGMESAEDSAPRIGGTWEGR